MVNPNEAGGGGEGNNNGDNKGKGKMVFDELSDSSMDRDRDRDRDGIPFLPPIYYEKYERLAESLHKQLLLIKAWKERSVEGKEKEEESPVAEVTELEESTVEERMKKIRAEISELKLVDSWEDMNIVERECVMCLSLEKTVAFLPCTHLALCEDCNVLHQRLGMNDCPTCRTPIKKRISVR